MVIVFDSLGASDELGAKVPETAEAWSSFYFIDQPYGRPDVFYTLFHHAHCLHSFCVIQPLGSLLLTAIYRCCVFGHFFSMCSPWFTGIVSMPCVQGTRLLTAIYRYGVL